MLADTALVITAWQRPDYLRQALASWAAVPESPELGTVVIALGESERVPEMSRVARASPLVPRIMGDGPRPALVRGEHTALAEALIRAFAVRSIRYVIVSCEDVVVSDDVLRYFEFCRSVQGACQPQEWLVACAHNSVGQGWHEPNDDSAADQSAVRLVSDFNPWCWMVSREAWRDVLLPAWDWGVPVGQEAPDCTGWDWAVWRTIRSGYLALVPDASRSQNIGKDGGVYAEPDFFEETQAKSFRPVRGAVDYRLLTVCSCAMCSKVTWP
jgi:hypothetical protein